MSTLMSGARMLLECLSREGVDCMFGYPGGVTLPLYDVLYDHPLRHVLNNELHARPPVTLSPPERVSHIAIHSGEQGAAEDYASLLKLGERYGITPPHAGSTISSAMRESSG